MVQCYEQQDHTRSPQRQLPGQRDIACLVFDITGYIYQHALREHRRDAIEGRADTDEPCLTLRVVRQHIVAVGGDVMRGRGKSR